MFFLFQKSRQLSSQELFLSKYKVCAGAQSLQLLCSLLVDIVAKANNTQKRLSRSALGILTSRLVFLLWPLDCYPLRFTQCVTRLLISNV